MSTQTITEFLEARIAEDEAAANRCDAAFVVPEPLAWSILDPARVLAECAAKRKIVQYATGLRLDRARDAETDAQYRSVWWVLWQFATAYKSHPEYREDWEL